MVGADCNGDRLQCCQALPISPLMRVFLDFEASSLGKNGFPIEVAWVFENGDGEGHLIRPAPSWLDWDDKAEAIHHIPRSTLEAAGKPHDWVAQRMIEMLADHDLYASAPSWDGKWLSALLRAAGLPRHSLRLRDSEIAQRESAAARLSGLLGEAELVICVEEMLARAHSADDDTVRHRALDDAEQERQRWLAVIRLADAKRAALEGSGQT
jgi:hypothetical protein